MNIKKYQEAVDALNHQLDLQREVVKVIGTREDLLSAIHGIKGKAENQAFRILIMGQFSSGKSTMINAFLGEPILPTKVMPATALITEIVYSDVKRVVVHPYPGKWSGGDEPFEVPVDKIREYCLIDHKQGAANYKEGNVIESPFKKMQVFWPLEMLKDGVEVVDSPGLNDPSSHDTVTLEYLPTADAIIYLMNGTQPYTKVDVETLKDINLRGYNTPVFVITRFDDIKCGAPEDVQEAIDTLTKNLSNSTKLTQKEYREKLGGNGIFFVSSLEAIKAKRDNNKEALLESGYLKMEKYIEEFLVKCKGDEKLSAMATSMETVSKELEKTIREHLNTVDLPIEEFEKRINNVTDKMTLARKKADLFVREFNLELNKAVDFVKPIIESFTASAVEQLPTWKSEYTCSVTTELTHLKRSAKAIADEYSKYLKQRFSTYTLEWVKDTLMPALNDKIHEVARKMEAKAIDLSNIISDIKIELNFEHSDNAGKLSTDTTKVVSVVYALFTGDLMTAIVGGILGKEAMLRTIGLQALTGIAIGIAACFTPIGLGTVVIGGILATIAGTGWSIAKIQDTITKKVTKEYKEMLVEPTRAKEVNDRIFSEISLKVDALKTQIKDSAYVDINQIEIDIKNILEEKKKGEAEVAIRKANLEKSVQLIGQLKNEVTKILAEARG